MDASESAAQAAEAAAVAAAAAALSDTLPGGVGQLTLAQI